MIDTETPVVVERVEMARLAGQLLSALEYLDKRVTVQQMEGAPWDTPLRRRADDLRHVRERLVELSSTLPMGPLEAFGREHPLFNDPIDGPYCGYGSREGKPYTCPVRDPSLHWDAWELLGTTQKRPKSARRGYG